jgi:predicted transcriptional regulator
MTTRLPQEIELWYIIPAIRREMARNLLKRGLRQRDVARRLGVTDAAVSQYFSSKRGSEVRFSRKINQEIRDSAERIAGGSNVIREVQRICRLCREDRICCHIGKSHGMPSDCRACFSD